MTFRLLAAASLLGALFASGLVLGADYGKALSLPGAISKPVAPPAVALPPSNAVPLALPATLPVQRWQLQRNALLHEELGRWAAQAGWQLRWTPAVTWQVAADVSFEGDFADAVSRVIENLYLEGCPVRLVLWEGNKVAEVVTHEVR